MPKLNMTINHHLPQVEALARVQRLLGDVKTKYAGKIRNLTEEWTGSEGEFSFEAMGFSVSGTLTVTSNTVEINGKLPFAAALFKGNIESTIRERADKLLA
ncbi:MAG: polyhydroxyalkanoic acid system family protein [Patescibacteria group bacterium]